MMVRSWRLVKEKYSADAFSGEGAFKAGGRWNSAGVYVVYASESIALASLEILAGGAPFNLLASYVKIHIDFDDSSVQTLGTLPKDWNAYPPRVETKKIGDDWIRGNKSVVLKVPSSVVQDEHNYMINPFHPDAKKTLVISRAEKHVFDKRLIELLKRA